MADPMVDATPVETWEHTWVQVNSLHLDELVHVLKGLGADGWELVSTHSTDPTVGFNSVTALMRRRIVPFAAPDDREPGWRRDPSGRHESRYWNGRAWTFHVSDDGKTAHDAATVLGPTPAHAD